MPTYDYRCTKCEQHIEVYQSFSEAPLTKHQECGGKLVKVLSPAGIVLKGSGFYKNDSRDSSRSRSKAKSSSSESTSSGSGSAAGDAKSSDSSSSSGGSTSTDSSSTSSDAKAKSSGSTAKSA
ncbi:MAG TPA: FmdB family zinc ribbon protein [Acidimicrobiia bacterium]|nr:FmdB family zinc ribbon protein [Acidimicrobiia bacterium]